MADKKISELTELTAPDGAEELVVNDSGTSKKITIDNLIADNGLSGNKIDGGTISNFTSTGIDDNATSTAITINGNEDVGVGVIPKTWNTSFTGFQVGLGTSIMAQKAASSTYLLDNAYYGSAGWRYTSSAPAAVMQHTTGVTYFKTAPTGTADAALTWTTRLSIANAGDVNLTTGNLVIGTSGKGIDFSATSDGSGTMTSEVLDDYETGTWTPTVLSGATSLSSIYAKYTKIGKQVTVVYYVHTFTSLTSSQIKLGGLPYTVAANGYAVNAFGNSTYPGYVRAHSNTTGIWAYRIHQSTGLRADITGSELGTGHILGTLTYLTD